MPKSADGELNDEAVRLTQRALYVEPLNYPLDKDKFPTNGHEYIHWVREEQAAIFPEETKAYFHMCEPEEHEQATDTTCSKISLKEWKNREANFFSSLALQLKSKRDHLMKKYPKKQFPAVHEEKDCCHFCLGSEMCKKIFVDIDAGHALDNPPYLSIVLHFSQEEILTLLGYMSEWAAVVGMNHIICRWVYALLACLRKPVSKECEAFLEEFYDDCVQRIKECEKTEKNQLHFISSILKCYFCIKAYKLGTPLLNFQQLSH